jgi:hypothetical protein
MEGWGLQAPKQGDYGKVANNEEQKVSESDMNASANADNGGNHKVWNGEVTVDGVSEAAIENGRC